MTNQKLDYMKWAQVAETPSTGIAPAFGCSEPVNLGPASEANQTQELTAPPKKGAKPKKVQPTQTATAAGFRLPELVSRDFAALALGVSPGTLDVWRSTGRYALPFVKIGRKVLYKLDDLATFIEQRTRSTGATE